VRRWTRARALLLATATAAAALVATGAGPARVAGADGLVEQAEWKVFPADTISHGYLAVDSAAGVGYAFSDNTDSDSQWTRVQAIDLRNGKPLSPVVAIPPVGRTTPVWMDARHHVLVYPDWYARNAIQPPTQQRLHGIGFRNGKVEHLFAVDSPLGTLAIAALAPDEADDDLVIVGTTEKMSQSQTGGPTLNQVQRLSLSDLLAGKVVSRWSETVTVPAGACGALIGNDLPTAVLLVGDSLYMPCRGISNHISGFITQLSTGGTSGVVEVRGVGRKRAGTVTAKAYRAAGDYSGTGAEAGVDVRMRRVLMVEAGSNTGIRVFDTDHKRYVGRINGNALQLFGQVVDEATSRVYFISKDPQIGLGYGDDAALVPAQGERLKVPFAALFANGNSRRLAFDSRTRRLFIPLRRKDDQGRLVESILVMHDVSDPYVAPEDVPHSAGTIDARDVEGKTESEHTTTARAYGADYQLVGGTANLVQNLSNVDTRGTSRPGTRYLRQAYVRSANLTDDGAVAAATIGEEDGTTNLDRHDAGAGDKFAPVAECNDYAGILFEATEHDASVRCDLAKATVLAKAAYDAANGVFITGQGSAAPVPAPIQMGNAYAEVDEQRAPGRGAMTTTIRAVADNVTIGGVVSFGRVEQVVTLTAHGRTGTAKVERTVKVSEVSVNGTPVCGATCSVSQVQKQVNDALDGRFWVDFPAAQVTEDARGTYAELTQDPYVHAERMYDYDKPSDDYVVPAMSVVWLVDGVTKTRLVTDFAGASGTVSYRVFPLTKDDFGGDDDDTVVPDPDPPAPLPSMGPAPKGPTATASPAPGPTTVADGNGGQAEGPFEALVERVRLSLRSLGDALPLLLIWALLGVPAYLSARRRLLLELPMLTRDEELT
jgi:hypothetical protein